MQTLNTPRAAGRAAAISLELTSLRGQLESAQAAQQRFRMQADEYRALAAEQENFRNRGIYFTRQTIALANAEACQPAINTLLAKINTVAAEAAELEAVSA